MRTIKAPEGGVLVPYCDLSAISAAAMHGCREVDADSGEITFDRNSSAVKNGIIICLEKPTNGWCTHCGRRLVNAAGIEDAQSCLKCGTVFSCSDAAERWAISEWGMAKFVARAIANGWAQPCGEFFHLGEQSGRDLYFAISPSKTFFTTHERNVSLVVAGGAENVPSGWPGNIAIFSELFYLKDGGEIGVAKNILANIVPSKGKGLRRGKHRMIHERREYWLSFLLHLLAAPYDHKAFYKGKLRRSYVCRWFTANVPNAPQNPKTYARDLVSFRSYFPDKDRYDFREPMIVMLLRHVADPQFKGKDRERMTHELTDLLHYLKSRQDANNGTPVEIPKYAWQYTGGKKGSRELVAVSADMNPIDDMEF